MTLYCPIISHILPNVFYATVTNPVSFRILVPTYWWVLASCLLWRVLTGIIVRKRSNSQTCLCSGAYALRFLRPPHPLLLHRFLNCALLLPNLRPITRDCIDELDRDLWSRSHSVLKCAIIHSWLCTMAGNIKMCVLAQSDDTVTRQERISCDSYYQPIAQVSAFMNSTANALFQCGHDLDLLNSSNH